MSFKKGYLVVDEKCWERDCDGKLVLLVGYHKRHEYLFKCLKCDASWYSHQEDIQFIGFYFMKEDDEMNRIPLKGD